MAGSKCAFLSAAVLDHVLGGTTYSQPGTVYVALSWSAFDPTSSGDGLDEVSGSGYSRVALVNDDTNWSTASTDVPSQKSNNNDIVWPTATGDMGTPLAAYVCDASTNGNALYGADISNPQAVGSGDTPTIAAGSFVFTED